MTVEESLPGLRRKAFYGTGEIAEYFSVSVRTVYRWIESGELPARKIGGRYRVARADLATFVDKAG